MNPIEDMAEKKMSPPALAEPLFMMARIWIMKLLYHALAMAAIQVIINSFDPNPGNSQSSRDA